LTAKKLFTPRFVLLVGVFLGSGLSQAVSAHCGVDLEAASYIERLQQSRERYAVSGTFLRESAGARDFISVNRSEDAPEGSAQYFNSNANNAKQSFGLPLGPYLDPCEVFEFYTLAITAGPKVAGKSTRVLQLRPRDTLRLGYSLALEEKSGVILRSDTISEKGELLEQPLEQASATHTFCQSVGSAKGLSRSPRSWFRGASFIRLRWYRGGHSYF